MELVFGYVNRMAISKSTVLRDFTVVASNNLANNIFSNIEKICLITGLPAKVKHNNIRRVYDYIKTR